MGMVVPEGTASPDALVLRAIPAGMYARFPRTMAAIGSTWGEIYGQWLPASGYIEAPMRPAYEYYYPDEMSPEARVDIYVPLAPPA